MTGTARSGKVEALTGARSRRDAEVVAALRAPEPSSSPRATWRSSCGSPRPTTRSPAAPTTPGRSIARRAARAGATRRSSPPAWCRSRSAPTSAAASASRALLRHRGPEADRGPAVAGGTLDERLFAASRGSPTSPASSPASPPTSRSPFGPSTRRRRRAPPVAVASQPASRRRLPRQRRVRPLRSVRRAVDLAEAAAARAGAVSFPSPRPRPTTRSPSSTRPSAPTAGRRSSDARRRAAHPRVAAAIAVPPAAPADPPGGAALEAHIAHYRRTFARALDAQALDAVICPAYPVPAVPHGTSGDVILGQSYASLWNLLGYPAGVVPVAAVAAAEDRRTAGLPVGAQVAARKWREDVVLGLMRAIGEGLSDRPPAENPNVVRSLVRVRTRLDRLMDDAATRALTGTGATGWRLTHPPNLFLRTTVQPAASAATRKRGFA